MRKSSRHGPPTHLTVGVTNNTVQMVEPTQTPTPLLWRSRVAPLENPANDDKRAFDHTVLKELDGIVFREVLDQDPRPTFVLDLDSDHLDYSEAKTALRPVFCNAALQLHSWLLDRVTGTSTEGGHTESAQTPYLQFKSWVTGVSEFDDSRDVFPQTLLYEGMLWTGFTCKQRWRFVSGIQWNEATHHVAGIPFTHQPDEGVEWKAESRGALVRKKLRSSEDTMASGTAATAASVSELPLGVATPQTELTIRSSSLVSSAPTFPNDGKGRSSNPTTSGEASNDTSGSGASVTLASPENGVPDWTATKPRGALTEHMEFARNVDWKATPLGSMNTWSVEFREVANLVMRNPHPAALFWGEELTMLYNEAYKNEVAGNKHPELMGTGFSGPFSELWDGVGPIFRESARTGKSVRKENDYLPIERYGYLEETFFSWSFTPVYGGTNRST